MRTLALALGSLLALASLAVACAPAPGHRDAGAATECRFPSGRVCPRNTTCQGEGAQSCNTFACEVTGDLTPLSRNDCGAGDASGG